MNRKDCEFLGTIYCLEYCSKAKCTPITDTDRFDMLMKISNVESSEGFWRVTLDYDNYQDGARIADGDKKIISECYDIDLSPSDKFRAAINKLIIQEREGTLVLPPKEDE
jgi:hypothetical protein